MKILSFNTRAVGGAPKMLALKRSCVVGSPNVLLIQETMCSGTKAEEAFNPWLKHWVFFSIDANGLSGGLLTACSPKLRVSNLVILPSCIIVKALDSWLNFSFRI